MNAPFDQIELLADRAANRYRGAIDILRNQETGALAQSNALTPRGIRALRRNIEQIGDNFLTQEESEIDKALKEILTLAEAEATRQMGQFPPALSNWRISDALLEYGVDETEAQLVRDAAQLMRFHRKRGVDAQNRAMIRGISTEAAVMEIRIESISDSVNLWFTDRAGRRIASHKHIRRFWRGLLREGYLGSLASELAMRGALTARIVHPDPASRGFGEVVQLDGSKPDLTSFENVFHPNARASLVAENVFKEVYA